MNKTEKKEMIDKINNIYWQYNTGPQVVKTPHDLAVLTSMCAFGKDNKNGPIGVCNCLFNGKEEVTLIVLGGTQFKDGQATRLLESKLSIASKDNDYMTALLNLFRNNTIPKDKPVIVSGISLGGMIAQQLLMYDDIVKNFKFKSIICFGSPLTRPLDRKGIRIRRFSDHGDIVPKLGQLRLKLNFKNRKLKKSLDKEEKIFEDGKYKTMLESHALSYVQSDVYLKYDFYGGVNGTNTLELLEDIKYYDAPILEKPIRK